MLIQWVKRFPSDVLLEVSPRLLKQMFEDSSGEPLAWKHERLERMLERLPRGGEIDAPEVCLLRNGRYGIGFMDGRHRTAAAATLGLPTIKVAVLSEEAESVAEILRAAQAQ